MKTRLLLLLIIVFFTSSCGVQIMEELPTGQTVAASRSRTVRTRTTIAVTDSVRTIIARQRSPEMRLLDQTIFADGQYRSAMTKEEAAILGIPEVVYDRYSEYLERINK